LGGGIGRLSEDGADGREDALGCLEWPAEGGCDADSG
jgi:hypothetical protein